LWDSDRILVESLEMTDEVFFRLAVKGSGMRDLQRRYRVDLMIESLGLPFKGLAAVSIWCGDLKMWKRDRIAVLWVCRGSDAAKCGRLEAVLCELVARFREMHGLDT
jgi:hypothetical protein